MNSPSHLSNSDSHNSDFSWMPSTQGHGPIHPRTHLHGQFSNRRQHQHGHPTCHYQTRVAGQMQVTYKCSVPDYETLFCITYRKQMHQMIHYDTLANDAVVGSYNLSFWICLVAVARLGAGGSWVAGTESALTTRIFIQNFLWPFLTLTHRTWSQGLKKTETYQVSSLRHFVFFLENIPSRVAVLSKAGRRKLSLKSVKVSLYRRKLRKIHGCHITWGWKDLDKSLFAGYDRI